MMPKKDLSKYAGLSREEVARRMAEDERRAINEDPRTVAAVRAEKKRRRNLWITTGNPDSEFEAAEAGRGQCGQRTPVTQEE